MKIIYKYEACWILSFPSFKNYKIEIVYAPSGYEIKPHTHGNQDIKLMLLFGNNVRFFRKKPEGNLISFNARFQHIFRVFTINAGDLHYFKVSKFPLIFLNFEKWYIKPSSASIDLQLTKEVKETITKE